MATWHQRNRPIKWGHATQWTVVIDPPNEFAYGYSTFTLEAAQQWREKLRINHPMSYPYSFIVKPTGEPK
jgi:hypothetical protein